MSGPWTIEDLKREIDRNPDLALELWEKLQKLTAEVRRRTRPPMSNTGVDVPCPSRLLGRRLVHVQGMLAVQASGVG